MKVRSVPGWVQLSPQQQIVFDALFQSFGRRAEYSAIFEIVKKRIPRITKPRLSDMLRVLEVAQLIERTNPRPFWQVTPDTIKRLSEAAVARGKVRKGEL